MSRSALRRNLSKAWERWKRRLENLARSTKAVVASASSIREESVAVSRTDSRRALRSSNFVNPVFWLLQAGNFFVRYITTRPFIAAVQAVPAVGGLIAPLIVGFWFIPSNSKQASHARSRMNYFIEQKDYEKADFFARSWCFLTPNEPAALLSRARILDQLGRSEDARSMAFQLGQNQRFVPAVEWIVEKDLAEITEASEINEGKDRQLVSSLTWILKEQPENLRASFMLGTFYLKRGLYSQAIPQLKRLTADARLNVPEAFYSLAVAQKSLGQNDEARVSASRAADQFLEQMAREEYSLPKTIQTLRAMILAEREPEAAAQIRQLLPHRTESEAAELRWLLGEVYAQMGRRYRTKTLADAADFAVAIDAVYKALECAPSNPVVTAELVELTCSSSIDETMIETHLNVALNSGVSPGLVHFVLGTRALMSKKPDLAVVRRELELAATHNPGFPGLLNNLADAMAEDPDGNLDEALKLANQAIEQMPNQPHFFDTRGKILLKQHQYLPAIADLEKALAEPSIRPIVHEKLAECFRGLGDKARADSHEKMSRDFPKNGD